MGIDLQLLLLLGNRRLCGLCSAGHLPLLRGDNDVRGWRLCDGQLSWAAGCCWLTSWLLCALFAAFLLLWLHCCDVLNNVLALLIESGAEALNLRIPGEKLLDGEAR